MARLRTTGSRGSPDRHFYVAHPRRGAGACDSGDREDDEEPDRIPEDEAGTLASILTSSSAGMQSRRICRRGGLFRPQMGILTGYGPTSITRSPGMSVA